MGFISNRQEVSTLMKKVGGASSLSLMSNHLAEVLGISNKILSQMKIDVLVNVLAPSVI